MNLNSIREHRTDVLNYTVSTIRKRSANGKLYETLVLKNHDCDDLSDEFDYYIGITRTKKNALECHNEMVQRVKMAYFRTLKDYL